jgi:hypothetical protein
MGLILFIVARFLQWLLTPLFYLYAIARLGSFKKISKYFHDVAFAIDQLGNVMGAPIMNDVLLKKEPVKLFGNPDETISHCVGVNYLGGKLTIFGLALKWILNKIDKNHVEKAAENEQ